jgi:hypothetical protein
MKQTVLRCLQSPLMLAAVTALLLAAPVDAQAPAPVLLALAEARISEFSSELGLTIGARGVADNRSAGELGVALHPGRALNRLASTHQLASPVFRCDRLTRDYNRSRGALDQLRSVALPDGLDISLSYRSRLHTVYGRRALERVIPGLKAAARSYNVSLSIGI